MISTLFLHILSVILPSGCHDIGLVRLDTLVSLEHRELRPLHARAVPKYSLTLSRTLNYFVYLYYNIFLSLPELTVPPHLPLACDLCRL